MPLSGNRAGSHNNRTKTSLDGYKRVSSSSPLEGLSRSIHLHRYADRGCPYLVRRGE